MTTEAELLRAVIDAPDDNEPRLIYADALQAAGDPRGEYIALMLAQVRRRAADPAGCASDSAFQETAARIGELRDQHGAAWDAALGPGVRSIVTLRGFAFQVTLDCASRGGPALAVFDRAPITGLVLEPRDDPGHKAIGDDAWPALFGEIAAWLAGDPRTARLEYLTITARGRMWGEPAIRQLLGADLRQLRRLSIYSADGQRYLADALADNPTLRRLEVLTVSGDGDLRGGFGRLAAWPGFATVTELSVAGCRLDAADAIALAAGPHVGGLRELSLTRADVGTDGFAALAHSTQLAALDKLYLGDQSVGDAGLAALAASDGLPALTKLRLASANQLTDAGIAALASSPRLATLEELDLALCRGLGTGAAIALANAPGAAGLHDLRLNAVAIGRTGAEWLAASPYLSRLERLGANKEYADVLAPAFGARYRPF